MMPSDEFLCDYRSCTVTDSTAGVTLRSCGHSFHVLCTDNGQCVYCKEFLLNKVKELATKFNQSLNAEKEKETEPEPTERDEDAEEEENDGGEENDFYSSQDFRRHLSAKLRTFIPAGIKPTYVNQSEKSSKQRQK